MTKYRLVVGSHDISEIVESITWSGDTKQVARNLSFTVAHKKTDRYLPNVVIYEGDAVTFSAPSGLLFAGVIFDIDKSASGNTISYLAFDLMFYINNSDISKIFDTTPENITGQVSNELGIPFGGAVSTGVKVYLPVLQKKAYEVIMMGYTYASRQLNKKYIPLMKNRQLFVIEKGTGCGVTLDGDYNLIEANYKSSLQGLVNKVIVTDKNGNVISRVNDQSSQNKYGTVQVIVTNDGDKTIDPKTLLKSIEQTAGVTALSDVRAVAGYSLVVREPITGLCGVFYIESDTHTFSNGKSEMQLTLAFKNMMDEKEIEKKTS